MWTFSCGIPYDNLILGIYGMLSCRSVDEWNFHDPLTTDLGGPCQSHKPLSISPYTAGWFGFNPVLMILIGNSRLTTLQNTSQIICLAPLCSRFLALQHYFLVSPQLWKRHRPGLRPAMCLDQAAPFLAHSPRRDLRGCGVCYVLPGLT